MSNVSSDLIWEITREYHVFDDRLASDLSVLGANNSYLVKRRSGGGAQFSRDPLNVTNKHSRKVCLAGWSQMKMEG